MLEIEVLGHELVQPHHVHQVVQVVPLLTVLLVALLLLQGSQGTLTVPPHQDCQGIRAGLGKLIIGVHLVPHDHLLLQQEVLNVLESVTVDEDLPAGQFIDVVFVLDRLLQTFVVLPGNSQHLANDGRLALPVLSATELVKDREKEDYLVPLVQQEESVVLDVPQHLVVLPQTLAHLVIVLELSTLEVLGAIFELPVEQVALEVVLLVVLDQSHGVVDQFLPLPELAGVDDDQILAEVQFADIF